MYKVVEGQFDHLGAQAKLVEQVTAELRLAGLAKVNPVEDWERIS